MPDILYWLNDLQLKVRGGLAVLLGLAAVLALVAWLERSRRLNAFGALAKFSRQYVDPALVGMDRLVARAGGTRSSTPWWALLALLVIAAATLGAVNFVREMATMAYYASSQGPRQILRLAVSWTFGLLQLALLVRVVTSWIGGTYSRIGRLAHRMTEWMLAPLRRVLPPLGVVDISPLVAWFGLSLVSSVVLALLRG